MAVEVNRVKWCADLVDDFAPSIAANPWGYGTAGEVLHGAEAFEYRHEGQRALVAVRQVRRSAGTRLDVVALVSQGDRLDARAISGAVESIAAMVGANQLAMSTMRQHVAAGAQRAGWIQTGVLMIKPLHGATQ